MSTFHYTNHFSVNNSSVISDVYYDSNGETMAVVGLNGFNAGYVNVHIDTFETFKNEATYYSAGAFWNSNIKRHYTGWDTSAVDDFAPWPTNDEEESSATLTTESKESHFVIFWRDGDTTLEQSVVAADEESALSVFAEIMQLAGFKEVKPTAVTHFL